MNLLIDIGNSRLKWASEQAGQISSIQALDYRQPHAYQSLEQQWQTLPRPNKLAIACVGAAQQIIAIEALANGLWPAIEIIIPKSNAVFGSVSNAYSQPEKLGVDRWLALLAAHHHYLGNSCIIDCGTAITLDFIDSHGQHRGGLISPGLLLMKKSLAQNTAALDLNQQTSALVLADNTRHAIDSGCLLAAIGLIETAIQRYQPIDQVIMTGGDADLISQYLSMALIVDQQLVFKGLQQATL
ncbi:MAG: type III pantothenate kinase [Methylomonas sp.]